MQTNVLEYLENTVDRVPDKTAFADEESTLSFIQVSEQAKSIGTELSRQGAYREPVVVYMKKCPQTKTYAIDLGKYRCKLFDL